MIPDLFQRSLLERIKTAPQPHVGTFRAAEGPDADSLSLLKIIMPIKSLAQQPSLVGSATPLWKLVLPYLAAKAVKTREVPDSVASSMQLFSKVHLQPVLEAARWMSEWLNLRLILPMRPLPPRG